MACNCGKCAVAHATSLRRFTAPVLAPSWAKMHCAVEVCGVPTNRAQRRALGQRGRRG